MSAPRRQDGPVERGLLDGRWHDARALVRRLLELARDRALVVEIEYVSSDGRSTQREVEPESLQADWLSGWCRLRGDEREFHLDRIARARATREHFDPLDRSVLLGFDDDGDLDEDDDPCDGPRDEEHDGAGGAVVVLTPRRTATKRKKNKKKRKRGRR
jgi:predicted DNA-binding transcriptional regulator YafY